MSIFGRPNRISTTSFNSRDAATLNAAATFQGVGEDVSLYGRVGVAITSDNATDGVLTMEVSHDNVIWGGPTRTVANSSIAQPHMWNIVEKYFRIKYVNGTTQATNLAIQVQYSTNADILLGHQLDETLIDETEAIVTRSVLVGQNDSGEYTNVPVASDGRLGIDVPVTAFGELSTSELTPQIQLQFPYNINATQAVSFPGNGGSVTNGNTHANVLTGTSSDGFGILFSRDILKYNSGQGALARFTALFTTGVANSEQIIGCGNTLNGYFFGYNGDTFGVLKRSGGTSEIRTLQITTASTTNENITITLDSIAVSVPVTNTGDVSETALEIANFNYTGVGTGWGARAAGDTITFISVEPVSKSGTYSLSGASTAIGTFSQTSAGDPPTENWIAQTTWNIDQMDGTGPSGMTLDKTKGNVYQINYQWLGYGAICFYIESSATGRFQEVHRIQYANNNIVPSVANPSFPIYMSATNKGNTSDLTVSSSSMSAFTEGRDNLLGPHFSENRLFTIGTGTTEEPVITIHNKQVYQSKLNQVRIEPTFVTLTSNLSAANGNTTFRIYINGIPLNGTSYNDVSTNASVIEFDIAATDFDISDAQLEDTFILDKTQSLPLSLEGLVEKISPGQTLMITAQPSKSHASNEVGATISWRELF